MDKELKRDSESIRSLFKMLESRADVAHLLEVSPKTLNYFLYSNLRRYTLVNFKKKNGEIRKINIPNDSIKILQSKLLSILDQEIFYRKVNPVHGFKKDRSIVTNAKTHLGAKEILNLDLKDFFPSINFGRVRGIFMSPPFNFNSEVASTLAQLCCYKNELPQGAPTSPIISNMVAFQLDSLLLSFSRRHRILYTRYADDITLSSRGETLKHLCHYEGSRWVLSDEITNIIVSAGFRVNIDKTRYRYVNESVSQRLEVTNLVINEKINVSRRYLKELRAILHNWDKKGLVYTEAQLTEKYTQIGKIHKNRRYLSLRDVVAGKLNFVRHVRGEQDKLYRKYANQYLNIIRSPKVRYTFDIEAEFERSTLLIQTGSAVKEYGTGFYVQGIGIITAAHVVHGKEKLQYLLPSRSSFENMQIIYENLDKDLAILLPNAYISSLMFSRAEEDEFLSKTPYHLKPEEFRKGAVYKTAGYPSYTVGMEAAISNCTLIGKRPGMGSNTYLVQEPLYHGNSGGPVFDFSTGGVIGMSIRGGVPGVSGATEVLPAEEILVEINQHKQDLRKQLCKLLRAVKI